MSKRLFTFLLVMASATAAIAHQRLHNLDIRVVLDKSGTARITETRQMTVDSEG